MSSSKESFTVRPEAAADRTFKVETQSYRVSQCTEGLVREQNMSLPKQCSGGLGLRYLCAAECALTDPRYKFVDGRQRNVPANPFSCLTDSSSSIGLFHGTKLKQR